MKVLSWNLNGRSGKAAEKQVDAVRERSADVVCLQEVTRASYGIWMRALMAEGYALASTADLLTVPYPGPIQRKYFNVTAARSPIAPLAGISFIDPEQREVAFPEKYLAARILIGRTEVDVHNAHLPPGSTRETIKVDAFEAIRRRIDEPTANPRVLCGDFNTPQGEDEESLVTWASAHPVAVQERWDAAERQVLEHPELRDAYRALHRDGDPYPVSHRTRGFNRRYDHIYASAELEPKACKYLMSWLDDGLSDHAAVEAEFMRRT